MATLQPKYQQMQAHSVREICYKSRELDKRSCYSITTMHYQVTYHPLHRKWRDILFTEQIKVTAGLHTLSLLHNGIQTANLPVEILMRKIQHLYLNINEFTDLPPMKFLDVCYLNISNNRLTTLPPAKHQSIVYSINASNYQYSLRSKMDKCKSNGNDVSCDDRLLYSKLLYNSKAILMVFYWWSETYINENEVVGHQHHQQQQQQHHHQHNQRYQHHKWVALIKVQTF
ncbi:hypothetical protein PPL_10660 [Heterostelium album PN500]|uniref:Uncharacterized protein n=1 Tax=Heterostelium pallidum (strain ATCC 26659 / Pp 5 / PN500) TaxID=670386 RepID=D3BRP9_HETP5|nr:hypothetical protein PPL_10660 [Heterostelium album PN500]EFA76081.1 hypothetical protein PPL_10660 [Heterostelium album PN500]|eukprot:XP_020428215.1 hypothetical protein PPL_10660 [Heterostelium album PN500]